MTRALIAIALLLPAATQFGPAPRQSLCLPEPRRTAPHRKLDRVDKWQHDERTLA